MDVDHLLVGFVGTTELAELSPNQLASGVDRLRLQFGLERDGSRRFALWCLVYMFGVASDLDMAFKDEEDREAARDFMDSIDRENEGQP